MSDENQSQTTTDAAQQATATQKPKPAKPERPKVQYHKTFDTNRPEIPKE